MKAQAEGADPLEGAEFEDHETAGMAAEGGPDGEQALEEREDMTDSCCINSFDVCVNPHPQLRARVHERMLPPLHPPPTHVK